MIWHRDFPPEAREMWDVIAKALMLNFGGHVITFSADELRRASDTQAEIVLEDDGSIRFRVERH